MTPRSKLPQQSPINSLAFLATLLLIGLSSPASAACPGDCNANGIVSVDELVRGVNIALGNAALDSCPDLDGSGDGAVRINELVSAVAAALDGCPAIATPTIAAATTTPTPTATATETPDPRAAIQMDLSQTGGFLSFPWPNDVRRHSDGTLDLEGFPGTRNPLAAIVFNLGSQVTTGFGTNSAVFFQTSAPIDVATLPSPEESLHDDSAAMLIDLDDPTAARVPLLPHFYDSPGTIRPGLLLSLLPYPGHPLQESRRYAAIVFDGIHSTVGEPLRPAPLIDKLDAAWTPDRPTTLEQWNALRAQRDEVFAYVEDHTTHTRQNVVGFSVFTTQDVTSPLRAIAAAVRALPAPTPVSRTSGTCGGPTGKTTISGLLDLPKWQQGEFPYLGDGGAIVIVNGLAQLQSTERVVFKLTLPCGPAPQNGWPILLFMGGTGASASSDPIRELGSGLLPYVVASIAPLYSGERFPPDLPPPFTASELVFFNYLNPLAGRTNQIQQASEMMYLRRVVEGLVFTAEETAATTPVETDDDLEVIGGHSQGALTLPLTLAFDDAFDAGFLSSGGAGFYHSVVYRSDVRTLLDQILGLPPTELDIFHPALHGLQAMAEVGDAANYAHLIRHAHVLSIGGLKDGCSPIEVISHLATSLGTPVADPLLFPTFGSAALEPPTASFPIAGNLADGRTFVTVQLDTGHFGSRTNPSLGKTFVESLAATGLPTIDPTPLLPDTVPGCAGRFSPPFEP